jgi:hypothetical protein
MGGEGLDAPKGGDGRKDCARQQHAAFMYIHIYMNTYTHTHTHTVREHRNKYLYIQEEKEEGRDGRGPRRRKKGETGGASKTRIKKTPTNARIKKTPTCTASEISVYERVSASLKRTNTHIYMRGEQESMGGRVHY